MLFMLEISSYASRDIKGVTTGTTIKSVTGEYLYHISIIDYLQKYNISKKAEKAVKVLFKGANPADLSSTNVDNYQKRFAKFMKEKVFNFEFNHEIDVVRLNRRLEREAGDDLKSSMLETISKLNSLRGKKLAGVFDNGLSENLQDTMVGTRIGDKSKRVSQRTGDQSGIQKMYSLNDVESESDEADNIINNGKGPTFGDQNNQTRPVGSVNQTDSLEASDLIALPKDNSGDRTTRMMS
jgi:hypothetical protein